MCLSALFISASMFISCQKEQLPAKEEITNQSNDAIKQEKASNIVAYVYTNVPAGLPRKGRITVEWKKADGTNKDSKTVYFDLVTDNHYGNGRIDVIGNVHSWSGITNMVVSVTLGAIPGGIAKNPYYGSYKGEVLSNVYIQNYSDIMDQNQVIQPREPIFP